MSPTQHLHRQSTQWSWLRSVNNKSFNKLRKETTVCQSNAVDKELSRQVTDVAENHSAEQVGRKRKISTHKTGKEAKSVLRRAL